MRNKRNIAVGTALLSALLLPVANADDDTGFFLAASGNRLSADFKNVSDVNFDDSDTAGGIRFGYMFSNVIGIEAGYLDLGSYTATGDIPSNNIKLNADAFSAAVILNWKALQQIDLYAKLGAYNIDAESESFVAGQSFKESASETTAYGALGIELDFGAINLFAEYSTVDTDVNDLTIDIASVGIKYEFGQY